MHQVPVYLRLRFLCNLANETHRTHYIFWRPFCTVRACDFYDHTVLALFVLFIDKTNEVYSNKKTIPAMMLTAKWHYILQFYYEWKVELQMAGRWRLCSVCSAEKTTVLLQHVWQNTTPIMLKQSSLQIITELLTAEMWEFGPLHGLNCKTADHNFSPADWSNWLWATSSIAQAINQALWPTLNCTWNDNRSGRTWPIPKLVEDDQLMVEIWLKSLISVCPV